MKGVISAGDQNSAQAGADILKEGGNAYDAAIAVMLASPLCEPLFTSLGGGGFLLGVEKNASPILYDFFVDVPSNKVKDPEFYPIYVDFKTSIQEFHIGAGSISIPGMVKGIYQIHKEKCTLPLKKLIEPAVKYAKEGIYLSPMQASFLKLTEPIFTSTESSREIYTQNSQLLNETHLYKNPDYADFLENFAKEGSALFYEGEVAQLIENISKDNDGLIYRKDLQAYKTLKRTPIKFSYKEYEMYSNPPPSCGGILIAFTMKLIEKMDLKKYRSLDQVKQLIEALNITNDFRSEYIDEFLHNIGLENILQNERLLKNFFISQNSRINLWGNTTHISIIDENETAVSITTTNGEGSGHVIKGTGIMLNNMLGEEDLNPHGFFSWPSGIRLPSMMAPTAVLKNGHPHLLLGSAGSNRIRSAIIQTMINYLDYGMDIQTSINTARTHYEKGIVCMEPPCDKDIRDEIEKLYKLNYFDELNLFFGGVQAVTGDLKGGSDDRRGASVIRVE